MAGLEPPGVKPKTPDTVIQPNSRVSTRASLAAHVSSLLAKTCVVIAGNQRTVFAFSPPTLVVRMFIPTRCRFPSG